ALDDARDQVAEFVGCEPGEVVFTSGGTEADNLAITGVVAATGGRPICLATDHHAVTAPVLAAGGALISVEPTGIVDLAELRRLLGDADLQETPTRPTGRRPLDGDHDRGAVLEPERAPVTLVSVALANNEVGTIQPLAELAHHVRSMPGVALHIDAVAAAAWVDWAPLRGHFDLASISGHKVGGPKGIGALIVRSGTEIAPILLGGGQERERRGGTQNLAGAVALGAALAATAADRTDRLARTLALRQRLVDGLAAIGGVTSTGDMGEHERESGTVANVVHLCIEGVEREALLFLLDEAGVAASAGSSCASGALEPSHVLAAMGVDPHLAAGALRLSLGWNSTDADVDRALAVIPAAVEQLRSARSDGAAAMHAAIEEAVR
ncbi:MAG: putative cysteine desulfurase, partial [Acidimicrobiales bacterium]|nr:putative cysteine desulfurase [Acidimicrobiales bacterium]